MSNRPTRRALAVGAVLALVVLLVAPPPAVVAERAVSADVDPERAIGGSDVGGTVGPALACASTIDGAGPFAGTAQDRSGGLRGVAPATALDSAGSGPEGEDGNVEASAGDGGRLVHLVTGETVAVHERGGDRSYEVVSGGPVHVATANGRTYLLPADVDPGTYDRSLFDVDALLEARSGEGGLPVLLETNATVASMDAPGLENVRRLRSAGVVAAELDVESADRRIAGLVEDGLVRSVSLDRPIDRPATGAVSTARTLSRPGNLTGEGVTVAVLDTGIDATHPALAENVVDQVDLVDGESNASGPTNATEVAPDVNGHGTHVAGVVAGTGDDEGAHAGVAPGTDLVDVRVMNDRGAGRASTVVAGIEYAVERDVDVIVLSVATSIDGGGEIADSVEWATERGVVVVAAAGNAGTPRAIGAPGRPGGAITVGATDGNGRVAPYSSRGPTLDGHLKPDLVAPGRGIVGPRSSNSGRITVDEDGHYTATSGTSVAAPQVAGAAALLLEAEPDLTAREIVARLGSAARPVDGGVFDRGTGTIDVEGALDPDVVVSDPVLDFGLLETEDTLNRTISVTNHDDRRHDLTFDVRVRNVDLGVDATETTSLDRTGLSLAPGERANLTVSVDGETRSGAHAGEVTYAVDGEPRSVAFGFVRGGRVTVEKRAFTPGGRVDGEPLWVLNVRGTHDELLEFENGTASFVAGGGSYLLWSWATDEATGTYVFLSERHRFDGPTHLVLDERSTVPVGVDVSAIEGRYGPLTNRSVTVSLSADYGDGVTKLSVGKHDTPTRAVRVSADSELSIATSFLLTTRPRGSAAMDVSDVFQLAHGVEGVRGPSVVPVAPDGLSTAEQHLHRSTVDETYRVMDQVRIGSVWNRLERRWYGVGSRRTQRLHRYPAEATFHRSFRGSGWVAHRAARGGPGEIASVLSHPMHGLLETLRFDGGNVTITGVPFADGSGTRFDPAGDHRLTVSVDGTVARDERVRDGSVTLDRVPIEPGGTLSVRLVGDRSGGFLASKTLTEVTVPGYDPAVDRRPPRGNQPPIVTDVSIPDADSAGAVPPGEVTAVFEVDAVGPLVNPAVWYAVDAPGEPPWEDGSAWRRAETERRDGRLHATFDAEGTGGTISLAASLVDIRGHRTRTMTVDAVHLGEAPNTSSSSLAGRLLAADGAAAANDTVVVAPVDGGRSRYVPTDGSGRFSVELPRGRSYDLTYLHGEPWVASEPTGDGLPAWHPLARVTTDEDVALGNVTLPRARIVSVEVTDERGEPVPGATVRLTTQAGNRPASENLETGADGLARRFGNEAPGIALAGDVEVVVEPPEDGLYPDQEHRYAVAGDGPHVLNVTLETAPPTAVLTAFGRLEPGAPLFLEARESEVPAGVAEYRWDFDGDGETDLVTERPLARYVPSGETARPTLTVVDEAGKTDASTLSVSLAGG